MSNNIKKCLSIFFLFIFTVVNMNTVKVYAVESTTNNLKVNNKVLVITPDLGDDKLSLDQEICRDYIKNTLETKGYSVTIRTTKGADTFKNMEGYGFIFIYTHGVSIYDDKGNVIDYGLWTGKTESEMNDKEILYKKQGSLGVNSSKDVYINGKFISDNNKLDNSIVYLGACCSAKEPKGLFLNFLNAGACFVTGFDTEINSLPFLKKSDSYNTTKEFINNFMIFNQSINECIVPMTDEYKSSAVPLLKYKMSFAKNPKFNYSNDSKIKIIPTVIKPGKTIEIKNNIPNSLTVKMLDTDGLGNDGKTIDIIEYEQDGSIYNMQHNADAWVCLYVENNGKTVITNTSNKDIEIKVVKDYKENITYSSDISISWSLRKALTVIDIQPNQKANITNNFSKEIKVGFNNKYQSVFTDKNGRVYNRGVNSRELMRMEPGILQVTNVSNDVLSVYFDDSGYQ